MSRTLVASLGLALVGLASGCDDRPSAPSPPARPPSTARDVATFSQIMLIYRFPDGRTPPRSREEALALARDLLRRARGGESFDALLREHTDDRGDDGKPFNGGSYTIGRTAGAVLQVVRDTVFRLEPGEVHRAPLDTDLAVLVVRRDM